MAIGLKFPVAMAVFAVLALVGLMGVFAFNSVQSIGAQSAEVIKYAENGTGPVATFNVMDPEANKVEWTLGGDDEDLFDIDENEGVLTFKESPDYEVPDDRDSNNIYELTVTATETETTDNGMDSDPFPVEVRVTNQDEPGMVVWTIDHDGDGVMDEPLLAQFQVGAVLAAKVTDGDVASTDKDVSFNTNVEWKWYRSQDKTGMGTEIIGAISDEYTVADEDVGHHIRAEGTYVLFGQTDMAAMTSDYPVLAAASANAAGPVFARVNVTRDVAESKQGAMVGAPVIAMGGHGVLNYTLSGIHDYLFQVDPKTGQITTTEDLDYEANDCSDSRCEVEITATDAAGASSDPMATVTIRIGNVDEKPYFSAGAEMASVPENTDTTMAVDSTAYEAIDPEGSRVNLSLMGHDSRLFRLDFDGKLFFRAKPDYESPKDRGRDNTYDVTVRASDGRHYAERAVRVMVTDANEAPEIIGKDSFKYKEDSTDHVATFRAKDPEGDKVTWGVAASGTDFSAVDGIETADAADAAVFEIDEGMLKFAASPDHEDPGDVGDDNTYNVVVSVTDPGNLPGYKKVTVMVTDADEDGMIAWGITGGGDLQFQVGSVVAATLTDGDESVSDQVPAGVAATWRWYRLDSKNARGTPIPNDEGGNAATYTVLAADAGKYIRSVASYRVTEDGSDAATATNPLEMASLTSENRVLAALVDRTATPLPMFDPPTVARNVPEGEMGAKVGDRVVAKGGHGKLNYTLAGADATGANAKFKIDPKTGQITTTVDLDYEPDTGDEAANCRDADFCTVEVTATDSAGGATSPPATVTIKVTNVNEKPELSGRTMCSVEEGQKKVSECGAYTPEDPENESVTLTLKSGADSDFFRLTVNDDLEFRTAPDYENPRDRNRDNMYEVTVRANDGRLYTEQLVKVTVTPVNEKPEIMLVGVSVDGPSRSIYAENGTGTVAVYNASQNPVVWSLLGEDRDDFLVSGGMLRFQNPPDYENPSDADTDNIYEVTVKASYMTGGQTYMAEQMVMVMVSNVDEVGVITLNPDAPVTGAAVSASLSDPDGMVTNETWQWSKSMTMDGTFMDIAGATMTAYTPMTGDVGYYIKAKAMYNDGEGMDKSAMATTGSAVAGPSDDASLSDLSISAGTLTPAFMPSVTSYTAMVENGVASVNVMASASDSDATVSGDGMKELAVGENAIAVTVTAEDGTTTMTYTVTVTRAALNDDASLSDLSISAGTLTPAFMPSVTSYTALVDDSVASVNVMATASASGATVSGDGSHALVLGANTISVTVTAEDGTTTMTYTVVITVLEAVVAKYDDPRNGGNGNGIVDRSEVINAINDYLFGNATRREAIRLIELYLELRG